jgi:hypothetical protein
MYWEVKSAVIQIRDFKFSYFHLMQLKVNPPSASLNCCNAKSKNSKIHVSVHVHAYVHARKPWCQ